MAEPKADKYFDCAGDILLLLNDKIDKRQIIGNSEVRTILRKHFPPTDEARIVAIADSIKMKYFYHNQDSRGFSQGEFVYALQQALREMGGV